MADEATHESLAASLRERVLTSGVLAADLRSGAMSVGAGATTELAEPFAKLAALVGESSYKVTDGQVQAVRDATGSDKAAFEIVMSASIGAGLRRWDAAVTAIEAASDATS
jgi:hypothetical protein